MPELPEVETIRRGLNAQLTGKYIEDIIIRRRDLRIPISFDFERLLKGQKLKRIVRRAKYLLFYFEDDRVLLAHLGMSGRLLIQGIPYPPFAKHDHVMIQWSGKIRLVFNDPRRFGLLAMFDKKKIKTSPLLKKLGPEPLSSSWNGAQLYESLLTCNASIKTAIMDQRRVVGVGNIYACEALFMAHIHPESSGNSLRLAEANDLAYAIKAVLIKAIASGGSTVRNYKQTSGEKGYFQHHFSVYGRNAQQCITCKSTIVVIRQSGRSTFFCPHCQML